MLFLNEVVLSVELYVTNDDGVTYSYQEMSLSPWTIQVEVADDTVLDSYIDLILAGMGITWQSLIQDPTDAVAGVESQIFTVVPRNVYDIEYYQTEESDFFIVNMLL